MNYKPAAPFEMDAIRVLKRRFWLRIGVIFTTHVAALVLLSVFEGVLGKLTSFGQVVVGTSFFIWSMTWPLKTARCPRCKAPFLRDSMFRFCHGCRISFGGPTSSRSVGLRD